MRRTMLVILAMLLILPIFPFVGRNQMAVVRADGTATLNKYVDVDGNLDYLDDGRNVFIGGILRYRIDWTFDPGSQDVVNPYVIDTLPPGTTYRNPSANPTANVEFSLNGGVTWNPGEPPNGAPAGTMIRWRMPSLYLGWTGANGSPWNMIQGLPQPSDIDVSRTNSGSPASISEVWYDMVLDSNGYPCIVWQDNGDPRSATPAEPNIYFVRWNGTGWICQNGVAYNPTAAYPNVNALLATPGNLSQRRHPRLALDANGYPHVVYDAIRPNGDVDIHYVRWDSGGNQWVNNTGNSPSSQSFIVPSKEDSIYPQIQIGADGYVKIGWFEYVKATTSYSIFFCELRGGSTEYDLAGGTNVAGYPIARSSSSRTGLAFNFTLDSNSRPHVAFEYGNPAEINYVRWNGSSWRTISNTVYSNGNGNITNTAAGDSVTPWIKLDSNNNPRVTWNEIRLPGPTNTICYMGYDSVDARWELADTTPYNANTLNAGLAPGTQPSMDLDKNDRPCIAFNGGFMRYNGANWVNGGNNLISVNTTDGTGSLNTFAAPFNPIDVRTINGIDKVGISTALQGNPTSIYDVAYIQMAIPAPMSGTFYFSVDAANVQPAICNQAEFTHQHTVGGPADSFLSNTVCNPMNEIGISKMATKPNYMKDEDIGFDIIVSNPTGGVISNVIVTDAIPANLLYKDATTIPTSVTPTTITFDFGNMPALSTIIIHINFIVDPNYVFNNMPLMVTNVATVASAQFPLKTARASARIDEVGLTITKVADKEKYKPLEKVTYTIFVENLGTLPYEDVMIEDPLPTDLVFESITPEEGSIVDNIYKIYIGTLNPGESRQYVMTFSINKISVRNGVNNGLTFFMVLNTATLKTKGYEDLIAQARIKVLLPKLTVAKLTNSYWITPDDMVTFTIIAKNVSEVETTNTVLYDSFPNELVFVSALPSGVAKPGKIVYDLGTFNPGESRKYTLTFSVKHQETWPDRGIQIINTAILTCSELDDVIDHAMLMLSPRRYSDPLELVCKWINLNAKTNVLSGNDLSLELYATGGGSPYDFTIDWGDGSPKTLKTSVPESDTVKADHTYTSGEYTVNIKCVDRGARTKILTRTIKVP